MILQIVLKLHKMNQIHLKILLDIKISKIFTFKTNQKKIKKKMRQCYGQVRRLILLHKNDFKKLNMIIKLSLKSMMINYYLKKLMKIHLQIKKYIMKLIILKIMIYLLKLTIKKLLFKNLKKLKSQLLVQIANEHFYLILLKYI